MKKTNKILAGILSAVVLMSPATTWAGPSITDKVVVVEDSVGKYIVTDKIEEDEVFTTLETEDKEMADLIKEVNEGTNKRRDDNEKNKQNFSRNFKRSCTDEPCNHMGGS